MPLWRNPNCRTTRLAQARQIGDRVATQPGVREVEYAKDAINGLLKVTHYAQLGFLSLAVILLILWALGLVSSFTLGGFIHILLVVAIIMILVRLISGRSAI